MKHAVKTARVVHASCRLVYLCTSHAGEAPCSMAGMPTVYCRQVMLLDLARSLTPAFVSLSLLQTL